MVEDPQVVIPHKVATHHRVVTHHRGVDILHRVATLLSSLGMASKDMASLDRYPCQMHTECRGAIHLHQEASLINNLVRDIHRQVSPMVKVILSNSLVELTLPRPSRGVIPLLGVMEVSQHQVVILQHPVAILQHPVVIHLQLVGTVPLREEDMPLVSLGWVGMASLKVGVGMVSLVLVDILLCHRVRER